MLVAMGGYTTTLAQINFVKGSSMSQVLAEAQKNKKIIFIDVYATWCGPCKWMDEHTFLDKKVAEVYNKRFINFKVDGDTAEGGVVRNLYKVGAYPTYLFVTPDGKALHRIEGIMMPETFIDEANFVLKKADEH